MTSCYFCWHLSSSTVRSLGVEGGDTYIHTYIFFLSFSFQLTWLLWVSVWKIWGARGSWQGLGWSSVRSGHLPGGGRWAHQVCGDRAETGGLSDVSFSWGFRQWARKGPIWWSDPQLRERCPPKWANVQPVVETDWSRELGPGPSPTALWVMPTGHASQNDRDLRALEDTCSTGSQTEFFCC